MRRATNFVLIGLVALTLISCALRKPADTASKKDKVGILVMAHGGGPVWDGAIENAVAPLRTYCPVIIAFGMADPASLQSGTQQLEALSVNRIVVVRIFIFGQSFGHQTEYFLGLCPDPPSEFVLHMHDPHAHGHEGHGNEAEQTPKPIQKKPDTAFVLTKGGLVDSPITGDILLERVKALSVSPKDESVLILAHGMGDDADNDALLSKLNARADTIRETKAYAAVEADTLREDWEEKRIPAEKRIRGFIETETAKGKKVIVVPFRVFGFGDYAEVLKGLTYVSDGKGLLPHPKVTEWIKTQAEASISEAGWQNPFK